MSQDLKQALFGVFDAVQKNAIKLDFGADPSPGKQDRAGWVADLTFPGTLSGPASRTRTTILPTPIDP